MTIEATLYTALSPLFGGRVFPDFAPAGTAKPYCTYQQVGGRPVEFLEGAVASKDGGRFQINVWSASRLEAMNKMRAVRQTLVAPPILASSQGGAVAEYDETDQLRGARQDFLIWYDL